MDLLKIVITSIVSLFALFVLTKLMGNRQVSELTMFDYIIGISIGSIAAEMATDLEKPIYGVVAMIVYAVSAILISFITTKFSETRKLLFGKSIPLMKNGKIKREGLKRAHLDLSEFLMQARTAGYFDISSVNMAFMEPNGKISFLPFANSRPANPDDMGITPKEDSYFINIIADGVFLESNLKETGFDKTWVINELKKRNIRNEKSVLLATLDNSGVINIFSMND